MIEHPKHSKKHKHLQPYHRIDATLMLGPRLHVYECPTPAHPPQETCPGKVFSYVLQRIQPEQPEDPEVG